jgi:type VI secretion system secreted protein VgrG
MPDISLTVTSSLPDGALIPVAIRGDEQISRPFVFHVTLLAPKDPASTTKLLRQPMCVTLHREDSAPRHFHGIVRAISRSDDTGGSDNSYEAELVPQLWFATQTIDCRVFHNLTTLDIVKKVLEENGVSGDKLRITAAVPAQRGFTVQYNESDFDFISRLLEEDGLFYFFQHTDSNHVMNIADANTGFRAVGGPESKVGSGLGGISEWRRTRVSSIREVSLRGYNAKQVADVVGTEATTATSQGGTGRDITHWYGRSREAELTKKRARFQQEAADLAAALTSGRSGNQAFFAGGRFKLGTAEGQGGRAAPGEYVIRNISHSCSVGGNAGSDAGAAYYGNQFVCFRAGDTYRSPAITPRPNMGGIHLGIVLAPEGEEIHVSAEGRIRVRMLWDHRKDATDQNTIEVRMMQPWSGNGWGMQHFPRVGTEVAVAFINGDPDDPIVVGSLYNGTHKHPFPLPAEKTKSGIKTRSTLKGGTADYNELFFDDKKGAEVVSLHAQKDNKITVENDQTTYVMRHLVETVDANRTRKVGGNEVMKVEGKQTETVKGDRTQEISQGNDSVTVKMGNRSAEVSMGNESLAVKLGNITVTADMGAISVEAMQSIELKVGANSVKIDQTGVTIKGLMVKIEAQTIMEAKGLMTKVEGSAMTTIKGGIILIG